MTRLVDIDMLPLRNRESRKWISGPRMLAAAEAAAYDRSNAAPWGAGVRPVRVVSASALAGQAMANKKRWNRAGSPCQLCRLAATSHHGGACLDPRRSVLIVDRSPETREVLRTVLEHRGLRILEASAAKEGLAMVTEHRPDLVVLDVEADSASPEELSDEFVSHTTAQQTPLVLLGTARRAARRPPAEFVAKPYHYAPLIRRIEQLLGEE